MSTIKIQLETAAIPVEIGKLKFEFDTSDESILSFRETAFAFKDELENIEVAEGDEFEKSKDILRRGFDLTLGEGSFEKIYKQTPSILSVTKYFVALTEGITEQLSKMGLSETQQQKAQKYVKAKQK